MECLGVWGEWGEWGEGGEGGEWGEWGEWSGRRGLSGDSKHRGINTRLDSASSLCRRRVQDLLDRFFLDAAVQDPFVQGLYETKQRSTMFKHVLEKLR